jgi:flagellar protein FliS
MTPATALRGRYVSNSVSTASPARLLTMLYDRLVLDLQQAEKALLTDAAAARDLVPHAQSIILELRTSLDPVKWSGGPKLSALYQFMFEQLVAANTRRDGSLVTGVRALVEPLRDAWHEAARQLQAAS